MSSLWKWLSYEPVQSSPNHRSILYRPSFILDSFLPLSLPQDHTHFRIETMSRPHLKLFHTPARLDFSFYCNKVTWNLSQTCWLRLRKQNNIKKNPLTLYDRFDPVTTFSYKVFRLCLSIIINADDYSSTSQLRCYTVALLHKEKPSWTPYTTVESLFNKAQVHRVSV